MSEVHYIHFPEIESTNSWAIAHAHELSPVNWTCVSAGIQMGGRGRRGQKWVSMEGNLHMSLAIPFSTLPSSLPNFAQVAILSLCQWLKDKDLSFQIKWPNDLYYDSHKVGGAMAETTTVDGKSMIVLGVGVNVNARVETDQLALSLKEITQEDWCLAEVRDGLIHTFAQNFPHLVKEGFAPFHAEFSKQLLYVGEEVIYLVGQRKRRGRMLGVTDHGELEIKDGQGQRHILTSGEIFQLRKA